MDSFLAREREREQAQGGQRELLSPEACVEVTKEPRGGPSNIRDGQVCSSRTVPATSLLQDLHLWHSCTGGNAVRAQPPSRQRVPASHLLPLRWAGDFAICDCGKNGDIVKHALRDGCKGETGMIRRYGGGVCQPASVKPTYGRTPSAGFMGNLADAPDRRKSTSASASDASSSRKSS